ncbi:hypothetical protein H310_06790 [Aphanomyces invadans]|uniref:Uncharacterized protein n=1 Tax=Aphanomyces invadans TaxID=157072 RepID=A0A024U5M0_9STRA|nr:hypothetical protein H310_06790 [Aphanomyces invadans]ETW01197.1 hypothetical protein H310_06790 [Aphanomyces invadans]|eukprot:XP_008870195.1 hypothetical protein H310_06790 [Aphanomyces invadans]
MHRRVCIRAASASSSAVLTVLLTSKQAQCNSTPLAPSSSSDSRAPQAAPSPSWNVLQPLYSLRDWALQSGGKSADDKHFAAFASKTNTTGLMSWPSLVKGLETRAKDEVAFVALTATARAAVASNDTVTLATMPQRFAEAAYGPGITPEMRNKHVEEFGCVKYTREAMQLITNTSRSRGVVEVGAGHGQWAAHLRRSYQVDILAYDNMTALPLSSRPIASGVVDGDESVLVTHRHLRGRVLLLVYPDPGPMAFKTLTNYMQSSPSNDALVYVGEGRGGANADSRFFDLLESSSWELESTLALEPFGTKGFERMFVFRRRIVTR